MAVKDIKVKNLVIGAGFSGLDLSSRLDDVVIVSHDVGGLIRNFEKDGFTFDIGGHVYTTGDDRVSELMKESNATLHEERKAFYMLNPDGPDDDGSPFLIPFPVQDNADMLGVKIKPIELSQITNLEEYVISKLGTDFYYAFMKRFNERVWCTSPSRMDFDWVNGRIQTPSETTKKWGMNASFYYAKGTDIIGSMLKRCSTQSFIHGLVHYIDVFQKHVQVVGAAENYDIRYEKLFCTVPYFLNHLRRNRVITIGAGLNKKIDDLDFHWMYSPLNSRVHRTTLISRYAPGMAPEGCDSLLLEIPYDPENKKPSWVLDIAKRLTASEPLYFRQSLVHKIICSAGFRDIGPKDIEVVWAYDTWGYPVPTVGSRDNVADIKRGLLGHDVYLAGRWGAHGYWNLQHIFQDSDSVMEQLSSSEPLPNYLHSKFYYKK